MKIKLLDFPYNLFFKAELGKLHLNDNKELVQDLIIKERLCFKILKSLHRMRFKL